MKPTPIVKQSASGIVFDRIKDNILHGIWPVGSRVPSEAELAEIYGVNRATVRTALQRLNAYGLIQTKVGEGSFVTKIDFSKHLSDISNFYLSAIQEGSVAEYRAILEPAAFHLAIERATEEEIAEWERRLLLFEDHAQKHAELLAHSSAEESEHDFLALCQCDFAFHEQLVIMSHNELLHYAFSLIQNLCCMHMFTLGMRRVRKAVGVNMTSVLSEVSVAQHRSIFEAFKQKDEALFQSAFREILNSEFGCLGQEEEPNI